MTAPCHESTNALQHVNVNIHFVILGKEKDIFHAGDIFHDITGGQDEYIFTKPINIFSSTLF